jgi:hypothetical protein
MNTAISYIDYLFITISAYPMVIQIAIFFIFANSLLGIFLMVYMVRIRRKKGKMDVRIEHTLSKTEDLFLDLMLQDEPIPTYEIIEKFERDVEKLNAQSIDIILIALENLILKNRDLRKSVNFMPIIESFDILNILEGNMGNFSTKRKLEVFQTLSNLKLTVSDSKILPHTYSKQKSVKKGSRTSYVAVSKNDPFKFFETNRETDLNEWDQISLMQQFETHHKNNLPDFSKWIKYTKQKSQIIFFVRMTAHFGQKNSIDTITDLLNHDDHQIRKEAILALGQLDYNTIEAKLMRIFHSQPEICQKAIILTITMFQTGSAFDFLKESYEGAANTDTKLLLAESLYLYKPKGLQYFRNIIQKEDGFDKVILQHVENPLIKSELREMLEKKHVDSKTKTKRLVGSGLDNDLPNLKPALIN